MSEEPAADEDETSANVSTEQAPQPESNTGFAQVSAVMEIKSSEFPNRIADPPLYISVWNQPIVVEFFQDNCQTCADLVWQEIGEVTHDVVIASYDCTENWTAGQICGDMKIKHTPELVYIEPGKDAR